VAFAVTLITYYSIKKKTSLRTLISAGGHAAEPGAAYLGFNELEEN